MSESEGQQQLSIHRADEIRVEDVLAVMWSGKILLIVALVLGIGLGFTADRFLPKEYKATSRWLVSPSTPLSGVMSLASLAGVTGQSTASTQNPAEQFYGELIFAPVFLDSLSLLHWPSLIGDSVSLDVLLRIDSNEWVARPAPFDRRSTLRRIIVGSLINDVIKFEQTPTSFKLDVELPDPLAAASLNRMILNRLMEYNRQMKQGDAEKEVSFNQEQTRHFERALAVAERSLENFQLNNQGRESPNMSLIEERLNREVSLQSSLLLEFRKQLEMAKITQARPTSPFTVIEYPAPTLAPSSPSLPIYIIIATFLMEVLAVGILFLHSWVRKSGLSFAKDVAQRV